MKSRNLFIITLGLTLTFAVGVLAYAQMEVIQPKMIAIYALTAGIGIFAIWSAIKKMKDEKEGQPLEDELTTQIKHKAGHDAYIASLYMWLFFFLFKDFFPDVETLLGGGILLTGLIGFIAKMLAKRNLHAESN